MLSSTPLLAAPPVVTDFVVGPTTITLTFQDDGSSNQFSLQKNIGLDAANWGNANDAVLTSLGANRYTFAVPRTSADKQFYRILGTLITGTPLDPDGDGIPTALENTFSQDPNSPLYSDPNLFDTDGDGFSDGVEFAMGTEPNNSSSKPEFAALPAVEFAEPLSEAMEGSSPHQIPLVGSGGFSGTIHFSINARSTATSPAEFTLAGGTVTMTNGTATLPVTLVDDLIISPGRLIMINLSQTPPGNSYRPAGTVTHVVNYNDNDCYWNGVLTNDTTSRDFRLSVRRNASTTQAAFVSGSSDGLATPDGGASSQSTGLIPDVDLLGNPQEVFPATGIVISANRFTASSPALPAPTGGSFAAVALKRTIALDANPSTFAAHSVTPMVIVGAFTESVSHATDPTITYLNAQKTGFFVLACDPPAPPVLPSVFVP